MPGIFAVVACGLAIRRRSLLHPVVLWTASWAFSAVLYSLHLLPYRSLSWLTAGLICGAVVVFAGGSWLGARIRPRWSQRDAGRQVEAVELAAWLLLALLGVMVAVFIVQLVDRFGLGDVLRISPTVKQYLSGGEAPLSSLYVEVAIAAATMCGLASATVRSRARKRRWLAATVVCASSVYFSTSRAFIVFALIAALAAVLLTGAKASRRWLATGAVVGASLTLVLFTGLGAVIGKTYGNSTIGEFDNFFSRHPVARPLALPYEDVTASIAALDLLTSVSSTWGVAHGCATAPIACGALRKIGVHTLRVPVAGPFTQVPMQWNGYTFLERFLIDFGTGLALVLVALTGVLAGFLWSRVRRGSLVSIIVYAISVPALLAAYRQNLIEIAFVASVLSVGAFWLCRVVLAGGPERTEPGGLRRVNALLQRLLAPPSERVALFGQPPEYAHGTGGAGAARLRPLRRKRPPRGALFRAAGRSLREQRPLHDRPPVGEARPGREVPPARQASPAFEPRPVPEKPPAREAARAFEPHVDPSEPPVLEPPRAVPEAPAARKEPRAPGPRPALEARAGTQPCPGRRSSAEPPERVDVAGRIPKTKEEWEHYARYVWASRLVRGTVLDVACGTGYGARLLARSARVTGVDRDDGAIKLARARANGSFVVADVPPIPIRSRAFRFVVCFETVEHIEDDAEFMHEVARVLSPRGRLLLSTPNAEVSAERGAPVNPWHVKEHTWESLSALLEAAGLAVHERYMQSFPPSFPRGHRLAWRMHVLTLLLPRSLRVLTRPLLGDAEVRRFKAHSSAPAYWLVIAEKRA